MKQMSQDEKQLLKKELLKIIKNLNESGSEANLLWNDNINSNVNWELRNFYYNLASDATHRYNRIFTDDTLETTYTDEIPEVKFGLYGVCVVNDAIIPLQYITSISKVVETALANGSIGYVFDVNYVPDAFERLAFNERKDAEKLRNTIATTMMEYWAK